MFNHRIYGSFHKWGDTQKWMVDFMDNPIRTDEYNVGPPSYVMFVGL